MTIESYLLKVFVHDAVEGHQCSAVGLWGNGQSWLLTPLVDNPRAEHCGWGRVGSKSADVWVEESSWDCMAVGDGVLGCDPDGVLACAFAVSESQATADHQISAQLPGLIEAVRVHCGDHAIPFQLRCDFRSGCCCCDDAAAGNGTPVRFQYQWIGALMARIHDARVRSGYILGEKLRCYLFLQWSGDGLKAPTLGHFQKTQDAR